jgi:hypothetical protein
MKKKILQQSIATSGTARRGKHGAGRATAAAVRIAAYIILMCAPLAALASTATFDLSTGTWSDGEPVGTASTALDVHKCWLLLDGTVLTVGDGADITVTGTSVAPGAYGVRRIVVPYDATVHITLLNVDITGANQAPINLESYFEDGANATITLAGTNILRAGGSGSGIRTTGATLTIDGDGSLKATGGANGGAGIGGNNGGDGGTVTINGGTVEAIAGGNGMAIGYGSGGSNAGMLAVNYSPNSYYWLCNTTNSASDAWQGSGVLKTESNLSTYRYLLVSGDALNDIAHTEHERDGAHHYHSDVHGGGR